MGSPSDLATLQNDPSTFKVPDDEPCPICLQNYDLFSHSDGSDIAHVPVQTIKCDHYFGLPCLLNWYQEHRTCPICRMHQFGEEDNETTEVFDEETAYHDQLLLDISRWCRSAAAVIGDNNDDTHDETTEAFDEETMYLDELLTDIPRWRRTDAVMISDEDDDDTKDDDSRLDGILSVGDGQCEGQNDAGSQSEEDHNGTRHTYEVELAVGVEDQGENGGDWVAEAQRLFEMHQMS